MPYTLANLVVDQAHADVILSWEAARPILSNEAVTSTLYHTLITAEGTRDGSGNAFQNVHL